MDRKVIRILGVIVGMFFISFGIFVLSGLLPNVPSPEWAYGTPVIILGVAFFSYGVTGKSTILRIE